MHSTSNFNLNILQKWHGLEPCNMMKMAFLLFHVSLFRALCSRFCSLRLREMMRRSLRAAGLGRHESGPSSSDHQDPVSPPIAPPSWVPDPPPMDPGEFSGFWVITDVLHACDCLMSYKTIFSARR